LQQLFLGKYRAVELAITNEPFSEGQILSQPLKIAAMLGQSDLRNFGPIERSVVA